MKSIRFVLGLLASLFVVLSISNEFANTPLYHFGIATFTRPLHALLGLGGLFFLVAGYKPGKPLLLLWIITAIPVIGVDSSKEWVDPVFHIGAVREETGSVRYSYSLPELTRYSARGVNFAPILVGIALYILSRIGAFPLFASKYASKIAGRVVRWGFVAAAVAGLGLVLFSAWLFSAPRVIIPSETGIQFYYKDQKLSEGFLRITPELIEQLGLDPSIPPASWEISPSVWARGFLIQNGEDSKWITLKSKRTDPNLLKMETPWGERIAGMIRIEGDEEKEPWRVGRAFPFRNMAFHTELNLPSGEVRAGQPFEVDVKISAHEKQPRFARLSLRPNFFAIATESGDYPKLPRDRKIEASDALGELSKSRQAEGRVSFQAPFRPGLYQLMVTGRMKDKNGKKSRPVSSLDYSEFILLRVEPDRSDEGEN